MFQKLVFIILAIGACGCTLLALRQSRLQAASELVRVQLDVQKQDEELWLLRTQIAEKIRPDAVRELIADLGPMRPISPGDHGHAPGQFIGPPVPPHLARRTAPPAKPNSAPAPTKPAATRPRLAVENR